MGCARFPCGFVSEVEISVWKEEETFVEDLYSLTGELEVERKPGQLEQMLIKKLQGDQGFLGDDADELRRPCHAVTAVRIRRKRRL